MKSLRLRRSVCEERPVSIPSWHGMEPLEQRLMLASWYVAPLADLLEDGSSRHPYNSIQEAIVAAAPGDSVFVRPGTYAEDLVIDKDNLTLTSAGRAARTIIQGVATVDSWIPNIKILGDGVVVSGFTIRSPAAEANHTSTGMIIDAPNVEIRNNAFQVASAASWADISPAIQTQRDNNTDLSGLNIHHNTFTHYGTGAAGFEAIFINHTNYDPSPGVDVTVANNTFFGKVVRGIASEQSDTVITDNVVNTTLAPNGTDDPGGTYQGISVKDYGEGFSGVCRAQANVSILRNVVGGTSAATGFNTGIRIGGVGQALTNFDVRNNSVAWNNKGVQVNAAADEVEVSGNSFAHNTLAVENTDADHTLNASGNWWDSVVAAEVAAQAGDDVDYTPWLGSGTDTSASVEGFQGDFSALYVSAGSPQTGDVGRIQEAHDLVTGSTVYVLAGTYNEDLSITKDNLNLIGAGRTVTTVVGQSTGFDDFGSGGNVVIDAANVTVTGFKFQSGVIEEDHVGAAIYLKGRAGNTAMNLRLYNNEIESRADTEADGAYDINGIETDNGNLSGTWIYCNRFTGTPDDGYNGIYVDGAVNGGNVARRNPLRIFSNTFVGNVQRAIAVETSNSQITGNNISTSLAADDALAGIQVQAQNLQQVQNLQRVRGQGSNAVSNVTIQGNSISGFTWAVELGMNYGGKSLWNLALSKITVSSNWIVRNVGGVLVCSSADGVRLMLNQMMVNSGYAVQNTDPDESVLDARLNWWGDSSGPAHDTNPDGTGDLVSDHVMFSPWQAW